MTSHESVDRPTRLRCKTSVTEPFRYAVSLGSRCLVARLLRDNGLRRWAGPLDPFVGREHTDLPSSWSLSTSFVAARILILSLSVCPLSKTAFPATKLLLYTLMGAVLQLDAILLACRPSPTMPLFATEARQRYRDIKRGRAPRQGAPL